MCVVVDGPKNSASLMCLLTINQSYFNLHQKHTIQRVKKYRRYKIGYKFVSNTFSVYHHQPVSTYFRT